MKPEKNLVAIFSLAAFEKANGFISQAIETADFADKYAYVEEWEIYQNGAQVEYRLRFFNQKKRWRRWLPTIRSKLF